jgi:hypothetical protein
MSSAAGPWPGVPDQPAAVRVYTDDEQNEAARYASEVGGEVVALPLSPSAGHTPGPADRSGGRCHSASLGNGVRAKPCPAPAAVVASR